VERTRTRFTNGVGTTNRFGVYTDKDLNSSTYEFSPDPLTYVHRAELITDVVGSKGVFHPCSHTYFLQNPGKPHNFVIEPSFPWFGPEIHAWFGDYVPTAFSGPEQIFNHIGGWDLSSAGGFLPAPEAEKFTRDAFWKCLDLMPEKISIVNFLLELEDLRGLIPNLRAALNFPGMILNWNFGWLPLIRDLKTMITLIVDVLARLEHLKKINRRWVTITHHTTYTQEDSNPPEGISSTDPSYNVYPELQYVSVPFHQVEGLIRIGCYYNLNLDGADTLLRAFCAALGIDNLTKIVWNAIPFSFVLDWFINLSGWLDQNRSAQAFEGTLTFGGTSCSFKTTTRYNAWTKTRKPVFGPHTYEPCSEAVVVGYHRRLGTPAGSFEMSGLTPNQQVLALSLLTARGWDNRLTRRLRTT